MGRKPHITKDNCVQDLAWGANLRSFPGSLEHLAIRDRASARQTNSPVNHGDRWNVLPQSGSVSVYCPSAGKKCSGRVDAKGYWQPSETPGPESAALYIEFDDAFRLASSHLTLRPGIILSRELKATTNAAPELGENPVWAFFMTAPDTRIRDRAIFRDGKHRHVNMARAWSVCCSTANPDKSDLVNRVESSETVRFADDPETPAHEWCASQLCEMLGLKNQTQPFLRDNPTAWRVDSRAVPFQQFEVVSAAVGDEGQQTPCVVASSNRLNQFWHVILAQCIPFLNDDDDPYSPYIPIGNVTGHTGHWSISPLHLRGIWAASKYVRRVASDPREPTRLPTALQEDLKTRLQEIYHA